jgi:tRNA nucleotidyltransferase/poly(A) polymerase
MKHHLDNPLFPIISKVSKELKIPAYVIGGYVRDVIIGRPTQDIDIMVVGSGIAFAKKVQKEIEGKTKLTVYKNFGTAVIHYGGNEVEFVGARKESYRKDSRKPVVEDGTFEDDLNRRDFTINAIAISLEASNFGQMVDKFDGCKDIKKGLIKTPLDPHITFSDDPLRMMRAIRFATQLQYQIDDGAYTAIIDQKNRLEIISMERIIEELNKIVLSAKPSVGFKLLYNTGLLQSFFPELVRLQGVEVKKGKAHKDNFYHTLEVLDNISKNTENLWLRWSAILHDIAKPDTKRYAPKVGWTFHGHEYMGSKMVPGIFKRFKLPLNEKMKYVQKLVLLHLRPISLVNERVTDSGIRRLLFDAGDAIDDLMTLCDADITSKNEFKLKKFKKNFLKVREKLKVVEKKDKLRNWQPPVTGKMIMEAFNIKPGKQIGILKGMIREAILNGEIENDKDKAYEFMLTKGKEMGMDD